MKLPKFEMDFSPLQEWTIDELKEMFGSTSNGSRFIDFSEWQFDLRSYTSDLPNDEKGAFLLKGVEFLEKCIEEHKKDCPNKGNCKTEEIWTRKISIAKKVIQEFLPVTDSLTAPIILPKFKFKGSKVDLIRIFNVLYEMRKVEDLNGQIPTKEVFMKEVGNFFNIDLSEYDASLSQAYREGSLEPNLKIFDEMLEKSRKIHEEKNY